MLVQKIHKHAHRFLFVLCSHGYAPYWWLVNIGLSNGLLPSGNYLMASLDPTELNTHLFV